MRGSWPWRARLAGVATTASYLAHVICRGKDGNDTGPPNAKMLVSSHIVLCVDLVSKYETISFSVSIDLSSTSSKY